MNLIVQFRRDLLIAAAALVVLVAIGLGIEHAWPRDFLTAIFAAGLLAMSLNMLIGYTGLVSFGHAAFFALGGYIFGLLLQSQAFTGAVGAASVPLALVAAVVGTGLYAVVIGAICVRLTEISFANERHHEVLEFARRALSLESSNETATGLLLASLIQLGRPAEAVKRHQTFCEVLEKELGISEATTLENLVQRATNSVRK
ncbi:ABC transporter permease subunit [Thalassobaculum salexigens]|uniref:ABC transporter permease subunit n=1 Tax=Thalassobaculum salexigens TaxID=455360 RepID=UPI00248F45FA|nr:BTAD domain-containing putative transcriptional regulator [Thalassobaculum salexigens]